MCRSAMRLYGARYKLIHSPLCVIISGCYHLTFRSHKKISDKLRVDITWPSSVPSVDEWYPEWHTAIMSSCNVSREFVFRTLDDDQYSIASPRLTHVYFSGKTAEYHKCYTWGEQCLRTWYVVRRWPRPNLRHWWTLRNVILQAAGGQLSDYHSLRMRAPPSRAVPLKILRT